MIYEPLANEIALSQGDIIDGCPLFRQHPKDDDVDLTLPPDTWTSQVYVLSQACDIAQSKTVKILVAAIYTAQELVDEGVLKAPVIRDRIRRGQVFGWYFLPAAPEPIDLPESIVDLRDVHTVSRNVLAYLIGEGKRICRYVTPYREHLAQHFSVTYSRIGLPEPLETS